MSTRCPTCKRPTDPADAGAGGAFPFCSERCKLIDLGRWLSDAYQIPADPSSDDDESPPPVWEDPNAKRRPRPGR